MKNKKWKYLVEITEEIMELQPYNIGMVRGDIEQHLIQNKYFKELKYLNQQTDRELHIKVLRDTFPDLSNKRITKSMNRIYGELS